jgi:hypothetical protein
MSGAQSQKSPSESRSQSASKNRGKNAAPQVETAEPDENYNLISVLYHALKGAETTTQYIRSSRGDDELKEFFETTRQKYNELAAQARELLAERLESSDDESEEEEEEDADEE